jgi:DNA-binding HxlR family transcriptional regulator
LELIADKWVVLVIRALDSGPQHYGELRRRIQGITKKMLTQTLRELERNGLVHRRVVDAANPPRVEYSLSPLGTSLLTPIRLLSDWAMDNLDEVRQARARYDDRAPDPRVGT